MFFGSIPALVTPFSGNCVAEDSLREFVEWQIAEGSNALVPCGTTGEVATLKIRRVNIAERLYRVTGEGIYLDSVLLGRKPPIEKPLLDAQVVGQDSVQSVVYHGKAHFFWGDTNSA